MYFALVYYPRVDNKEFHRLREKYEPYNELLPEHLVFVFPVPEDIGLKKLENHIKTILAKWKPFEVHFHGFHKSPDHWLFLVLAGGNDLVHKLHDELYTDILAPHLRDDLPYLPHVGLGLFSKEKYDFTNPTAELTLDKEKYIKGKSEFENLKLDFWRTVDRLTLVEINRDFTQCRDVMEFKIG